MLAQKPKNKLYPSPVRVHPDTLTALRMAGSEIAVATGQVPTNENDRIVALINHWNRTKADCYAIRPVSGEAARSGAVSPLTGSPNAAP